MVNWMISIFVCSITLVSYGQDSSRPNVVYILADDLGYGDVSVYNPESKLHTVNIDKLSERGVVFTDAHTSSAVCTPTRYGILTGRYNWRSTLKQGVLSGFSKALIEPGRLTVASFLKDKGYSTGFVGKWHLGWDWAVRDEVDLDKLDLHPTVDYSKPIENGPQSIGFTYSYGFSGSLDMAPYVYVENSVPTAIPTDSTVNRDSKGFWRKGLTAPDFEHIQVLPHLTQKAADYIEDQAETDRPFFLYLALPAPHTPILPTKEFIGKSNTNFYGDFVLQVDHVVGTIMEKLEEIGQAGNTIFIFTSDNGCSPRANFKELASVGHYPSYIFRGHKADIYEGGHRVPFIVRWPERIKTTQYSNEVICTTDLLATLADLLGERLSDDEGEDSYSFLPVLNDEPIEGRLREATVHHSIEGRFALRQDEWKLILWPGSGGWSPPMTAGGLDELPRYQLYNLEKDPGEKTNLVAEYPDRVEAMKTLLASYVTSGRSTPGKPQSNDGGSSWKQLEWMEQ